MLTVAALALLLVVGANTNNLVLFYAIGVFTNRFRHGWVRHGQVPPQNKGTGLAAAPLVINVSGGVYTALVVVIFAVVKFTEGAWLVVAVFLLLVFAFIKLNGRYRAEAAAFESTGAVPATLTRPELSATDRARAHRRR